MTPDIPRPRIEHEDPATARFMKEVENATVGGRTIGDCKYKLHSVGNLLVATVHRIYPRIFSIYAQDSRQINPITTGIEFDAAKEWPVGRKLQKSFDDGGEPLDEHVVRNLKLRVLGARGYNAGDHEDEIDDEPDEVVSSLLGLLEIPPPPSDFMQKFREIAEFTENMVAEGLNDPKPENVEKVSNGLEIITSTGMWRRRKTLTRAELLIREGLEIVTPNE